MQRPPLRGGPRRFSELRADIPLVSPKVLTTRLREMEEDGVVLRRVMPTSPPSVEYELTPLGARLVPAIEAIAEVGEELKKTRAKKRGKAIPGARESFRGRRRVAAGS